jgi:threonine dehydrogenase-like Zn-dependent dehydrogenase
VTTFCPSGADRMEYLMNLLQYGNLNVDGIFTHRMKLDDMGKAYDLFRDKTEGVLKIAITP